MSLNNRYWRRVFRSDFVPQLSAIIETLERRLIPQFEGINAEAEKVSEEAWDRFMSMPSTGDEDPGDFAEAAQEAGVLHYSLMNGIRQGMLNLFAVALYHAFEQQLMLFYRKEVLHPAEENDLKLFALSVLTERLHNFGVAVEELPSWNEVNELRIVANTVKHAEGSSARKLRSIRPDLFKDPATADLSFAPASYPRVFQPLVGEDLFVSIDDIKDYHGHLVRFWEDFYVALQCA